MEVVIIGGGASGLICAIRIKELLKDKVNVTICERLEKVGKKILATGNGKCNYTNVNVSKDKYNNPKFVSTIIDKYSSSELINYFESLGLYSKELTEGRIYPYTEQASTLLDVLRLNLSKYNVKIEPNFDVNKIVKKDNQFQIYNRNKRAYYINSDYVVLSTGGKSAQILGSNGSGFDLAKNLKMKVSALEPGLVGLISDPNILKQLNGLRYKCDVSLYDKKLKKEVFKEFGEVQFKNDGLSGIVVMEASSYLAHHPSNYQIKLDLFKEKNLDEIKEILKKRKEQFMDKEIFSYLTGFIPKSLATIIYKKANLDFSMYVKDLNQKQLNKIASFIKEFTLDIKDNYGFDKSQITIGGVEVSELKNDTLESKKISGLYLTGEIINIDGRCGGYNLHWAFSSALLVASAIVKEIQESKKTTNVRNKKH